MLHLSIRIVLVIRIITRFLVKREMKPLGRNLRGLVFAVRQTKIFVVQFVIKAKPIASCTLNAMFTRMKGIRSDLTVHATRATISTILGNHDFDEELIDLILAHEKRGSAKPYMNQKKLVQRRDAMQYYADLVDKVAAGANVVPLVRRKQAAA